jgi:hypothetical protein
MLFASLPACGDNDDTSEKARRTRICQNCVEFVPGVEGCSLVKCNNKALLIQKQYATLRNWRSKEDVDCCPKQRWTQPKEIIGKVFLLGAPSGYGGADTEAWHTILLWRQNGMDVHVLPTWNIPGDWKLRCEAVGCTVHTTGGATALQDIPDLAGRTVVGFCNKHILTNHETLRKMGCRLVWANCMTWPFPAETKALKEAGPFDVHVFQSQYQFGRLYPKLTSLGLKPQHCRIIHGAFMDTEFRFKPRDRNNGDPFVMGRLSRADADKYAPLTWDVYGRVGGDKRARLMGWEKKLEKHLGLPPEWAEVLPPAAETVQDFLESLHAMVPLSGSAHENWPRTGLEAMAVGVPIVTHNAWGWKEMIRHGETGFLCDSHAQVVQHLNSLANDEELRMKLVKCARRHLVLDIANRDAIWAEWKKVFQV